MCLLIALKVINGKETYVDPTKDDFGGIKAQQKVTELYLPNLGGDARCSGTSLVWYEDICHPVTTRWDLKKVENKVKNITGLYGYMAAVRLGLQGFFINMFDLYRKSWKLCSCSCCIAYEYVVNFERGA